MFLRNLFEATQNKTAVLGWGRGMGHKGHMLLAKAVLHHATELGAKPYFVVSRTSLVDPSTGQPWTDKPTFTKTKDDPLTPDEKLATYRKVFPQNADVFSVATADATKLEQVLAKIAKDGYNQVVLVVGEDQKNSMGYLTRPDKSGVPPYQQAGLSNLEIISRQDTTEPSSMRGSPEYQEGPRATPMRAVLTDPTKSEEEQFAVWRRDMPDNLSDKEVMDLMLKAKQRMSMVPASKRGVKETKRMSSAVKLQRAFDRERAKSDASRRRGEEVMAQAKSDWEKKQAAEKNKLNELGNAPPKKSWADYGMPDKNTSAEKSKEKVYHGWEEYEKDASKRKEQQPASNKVLAPKESSNIDYQKIKFKIQSDAHDMGDDFGQDPSTIKTLSQVYKLNPTLVKDMLQSDMLEPMDDGDAIDEKMLPASAFAGSKKNKLGTAGQWRNKGPTANRPAKAGDLVGGAAENLVPVSEDIESKMANLIKLLENK